MPVAMVAACPFPANRGTPIRIQQMGEALVQAGYDVHVVTYHLGQDRPVHGLTVHRIRALRSTTGDEIWSTWVGGRILGAPVQIGENVFFSTLERRTFAVRASDGKVVWRLPMGRYAPGIATERTYYFSLNGRLIAFRGRNVPLKES